MMSSQIYSDAKVEQVVPLLVNIPWGHNIVIISKCEDNNEALFYINKTLENGYSRAVLVHQTERELQKLESKDDE